MRSAGPDRIRILHVDDDPQFRGLTATVLERDHEGFAVETAANASEALERLESDEFDCVVSDYRMPDRNGIELLRAIRERDPTLPFILFTSQDSEQIAKDAIAEGATDYIRKQSHADQFAVLANRARNAVDRHHAIRDHAGSQARFVALAENLPEAVLTIDPRSIVKYANPAVERVFGYSPGDIEGESLTTLMPEELRPRHEEGVARYLRERERSLDWTAIELPGRHRDGHEVPLSISFGEFEYEAERRFVGVARRRTEST